MWTPRLNKDAEIKLRKHEDAEPIQQRHLVKTIMLLQALQSFIKHQDAEPIQQRHS